MSIKFTFDILTKQTVYAVCMNDNCILVTNSILTAIEAVQSK
jgi:hypothetical protein